MRLLVDIGNTRTKYVYEQHGELSEIQSIPNKDINLQWLEAITESVKMIIVASVSEACLLENFLQHSNQHKIEFLQVKSEGKRFGVSSSYQQPTTLGIDRWLTLLAANLKYNDENVLIVDAGTATTIDLLDCSGAHLGGWILPGVDLLFNSLLLNTSKVIATKQTLPALTFGQNTSQGVNNACWAATVGFIEQAIKQANEQVSLEKIVLTGGNAEKISTLLAIEHDIVDTLVFQGMQRY